MKLPGLSYADGIGKSQQVQFKGLNKSEGAGDGEILDMLNLSSDCYPLIGTRAERMRLNTIQKANGLYAWNELCWVDGTDFYYGGEKKGTVTDSEKQFTSLGAYIVILPDKAYYNTLTDEFGNLESKWEGNSLTFTNGKLYEEDAECNTLYAEGVDWSKYFTAGDAVTIAGCTKHTENNKTPIIREIDGDKMYFYEYVFTLDPVEDSNMKETNDITPYTETGNLTISRTVPDLQYICQNENRLWGCTDDTIYACKLGDIFNWNVYDGVATDSYSVMTGSAGSFTGCVSFLGYPIFFKEDHIYKVYGSLPSNFEVMGSATLGVMRGCNRSLAIAGEILFYLSRAGIVAYSGGIPTTIGWAFGTERFKNAAAGSDGLKYYVSMENEDGYSIYVYDTVRTLWHREDETKALWWAYHDGNLYYLDDKGQMTLTGNIMDPPENAESEGAFDWYCEFTDYTDGDTNKKGVSKIQIRLDLETGTVCRILIRYDSEKIWQDVSTLRSDGYKRSYYLPVIPRRADHYRLRFEGTGQMRIHSITREQYSGSELRSRSGRQ